MNISAICLLNKRIELLKRIFFYNISKLLSVPFYANRFLFGILTIFFFLPSRKNDLEREFPKKAPIHGCYSLAVKLRVKVLVPNIEEPQILRIFQKGDINFLQIGDIGLSLGEGLNKNFRFVLSFLI